MFQSGSILKEYRPDVVVGTGGYVAGPVLRSAVHRRIPTLIQEQNSYPGVTTRLLAKSVDEVHITFEQSKAYMSGARNIFLTGNPTRDSLERVDRRTALSYFGFSEAAKAKTILVLGGSLGARSINEAVIASLRALQESTIRVIWQTGPGDLERAKQSAAALPEGTIWIGAFIDRMEYAYAASDLVVSRAGATTIAELTRLGKPAILVPYPHAAANHQMENARTLELCGAAKIISDTDVHEKLLQEIREGLDDRRLAGMSRNSRTLGKPEAARVIAGHVVALARKMRDEQPGAQVK